MRRHAYVLIHGAWHGGWCWRRLVPHLRGAGHEVYSPTLTGLGERSHLLSRDTDLGMHVRDVEAVLEYEDLEDVVLVGHSYAGMIAAALADRLPARVRALVFLDAYVPQDGQCGLDMRPAHANEQLLQRVRERGEGWLMPPPPVASFGLRDEADLQWVGRHLTPTPLRCFTEPLRLSPQALRRHPLHYIRTSWPTEVMDGFYRRAQTEAGWSATRFDCSHDAMVDAAEALAESLLRMGGSERRPRA